VLCRHVGYASAGTVECIVDAERNFYFLEMNTRLQVEHPVTELVTGIDLVEQMIRVAAGERLAIAQDDVRLNGWAIESRLYAEDPYRNFLPSVGRLTRYRPPAEVAGPKAAVRNDTGVFEGGEISIYYDPMIAKLCTWAPDREGAIGLMREALDGFEVEGIGHNLPFLAAVMDHPRFVAGDISTGFIAEQYPDGFQGVALPEPVLDRLAMVAAALHHRREMRDASISGAMTNHRHRPSEAWVVRLAGVDRSVALEPVDWGYTVAFGGRKVTLRTPWQPGDRLASVRIDGEAMIVKVEPVTGGLRLRYRGADLRARVLTPRQAELAARIPEKAPPDTSKQLLCPMPGLVVRIDVAEGEEVFDGQPLCMVEAMKMENVLRAERRGVVVRIHAEPGQSLAVDEVIMEFE
jgi:propionyl-CoA carboxylase alpha chain